MECTLESVLVGKNRNGLKIRLAIQSHVLPKISDTTLNKFYL